MTQPTFARAIKTWRESPVRFVTDNFGVVVDEWQRDVLEAFASDDPMKKRIAMRACAGPGKSCVLAWLALNFLTCYGSETEHPKGAILSVTEANLKSGLWTEIAKWINRSTLMQALFHITGTRVFAKDHEKERFLAARSFAKTANAEEVARTLSGLHAENILYLIDEAGDIPPAVLRSAEQGIGPAATFGKIVIAGNPTSLQGMLAAAATTLAHEWTNIRISADPDDPRRTPRVPKEAAQAQIDNYGRDNPWVMAYILGNFPNSSINTLLSIDDVERSMAREYREADLDAYEKRLGVDVARFGLDDTAIFPRQGLQAFEPVLMNGARTQEIVARIATAIHNWGAEDIAVDGTGGYGSGVVDGLLQSGYTPAEIHFSGQSPEVQYANMRSYMHFKLSEWVKRGGALPNNARLKKELTAGTYTFQKGKFLLEPKEQIKSRLGFSTDLADSLSLTFHRPDQPSQRLIPEPFRKKKVKHDYDPFERA